MKTTFAPSGWFQTALVVGVMMVTASSAQASGRWATLEAIHQIENPKELTRPGAHGELGAYQFRETTWRMHSKEPFRRALDRAQSDVVAVKHYEWLKRGLEQAGVPITPYNIALAWNGGLEATVLGRSVSASHAYAQRAETLAMLLEERRVADKETATPNPVVVSEPPNPVEPAIKAAAAPIFFGAETMPVEFALNDALKKPMGETVLRIEPRPLLVLEGNF